MAKHRLPYTMKEPSEDTEHMFLAEIPILPGCRAWGETSDEALSNLRSVAAQFIASYQEHGDELPECVPNLADNFLVVA